jgi:hypothetical protein
MALRTAQADTIVYKFTGRDGDTVYSQTPPENDSPANVQAVKIESLPAEQQRAAVRMLDAMNKQSNAMPTRRDILQNSTLPTGISLRQSRVSGGQNWI